MRPDQIILVHVIEHAPQRVHIVEMLVDNTRCQVDVHIYFTVKQTNVGREDTLVTQTLSRDTPIPYQKPIHVHVHPPRAS